MAAATKIVKILFKGDDQASGPAKNVTKSLGGLEKAAIAVGAAFAIAAAAAVAVFTKEVTDCVSAASDAEEVIVDLDAALKSMGSTTTNTRSGMLAVADSLSILTRFDDEAVVSVETLLLRFESIGKDVMPMATEAVLNIATRLKMDLAGAAKLVGFALSGDETALGRLKKAGISFTAQQTEQYKAMAKTGDVAKAQAFILAALEQKFGGAARAAGTTAAGQWDVLRNSIENLQEELGEPILKPLTAVVGKLIEMANRKDIAEAARNIGTAIGSIVTAIGPTLVQGLKDVVTFGAGALKTVADIIAVLGGTYQEYVFPFALVPGQQGETGLAQKISDAIRDQDFSVVTAELFAKGQLVAIGFLDGVAAGIVTLPDTIQAAADDLLVDVKSEEGKKTWKDVGGIISQAVLLAAGEPPTAGSDLDMAWQWINSANTRIEDLKGTIGNIGLSIASGIIDGFTENLKGTTFQKGIDEIVKFFSNLGELAVKAFNDAFQIKIYLPIVGQVTGEAPPTIPNPTHPGMYAEGGSFIVPPGYPNDSFPFFAESGELIKIWPHNQVIGFQGGTVQPGGAGSDAGVYVSPPAPYVDPFYHYEPHAPTGGGVPGDYDPATLGRGQGWTAAGYVAADNFVQGFDDGMRAGASLVQQWFAKWPVALMSAPATAGFASVGIAWIDAVLQGMGSRATGITGETKTVLDETFKRWYTALKTTFGGGQSNIRRQFEDWMDDWAGIATQGVGESIGSVASRMLDTAIATGGTAIANIISANKDLFIALLGDMAAQTSQEMFAGIDKILSLAGAFGGFGGAVAERYQSLFVDPLQATADSAQAALDLIADVDKQRLDLLKPIADETKKLTALQTQYNTAIAAGILPSYLTDLADNILGEQEKLDALNAQDAALVAQRATMGDQVALTAQLAASQNEIKTATESMLALQKQQADLSYLQAQLDFMKVIQENGLNAADILGGLELGLGASMPGLIDAMTRAVQQLVVAAQTTLGIHSPSSVFAAMGTNAMGSFGAAAMRAAPTAAGYMNAGMNHVINTTYQYDLTANYKYESEQSLMDRIKVLRMLQ